MQGSAKPVSAAESHRLLLIVNKSSIYVNTSCERRYLTTHGKISLLHFLKYF